MVIFLTSTKKNYSDMRGAHSAPLPMTKLTKLIEKRNAKFDDAVTRYLEDCEQNVKSCDLGVGGVFCLLPPNFFLTILFLTGI